MNRIHQTHKIYEPKMSDSSTLPYHCSSPTRGFDSRVEYIGSYNEYKKYQEYGIENRRIVTISPKILAEKEKAFDFISSHDVPIGNKIEIDGQEYAITNKKYQLNGDVDYYVEDRFIKCESYEELYEKELGSVKAHLLEMRELEKQRTEEEVKKKKSIWWYFGIR